ncbi:MAG: glycosyltransferase [Deltaproteobacteria bacterium]|nr:glycosyltransferase [Deltaproteobacteria bacterium]
MTAVGLLAAGLVGLGMVFWTMQLVFAAFTIRRVRTIAGLPDERRETWPRVSVIVAACNERETIESAMAAKMSDDYPNVEFVVVDDRSDDGTGEVVEALAARDPRVRAVHVAELPEGWLGKLNAMEQGRRAATGQWLVFSDADVHFRPGTLRRVIAFAERAGFDHVPVFPALAAPNWVLGAIGGVFNRMLAVMGRLWAVEDPRSKATIGSGSFNMVRRTALERAGGLARVKLDVADDVALGALLKRSGARQTLLVGRGFVEVALYRTVGAMARGSERAPFTTVGDFSFWKMLFFCVAWTAMELGPALAFLPLFPFLPFPVWPVGVVWAALSIGIGAAIDFWLRRKLFPALLWPLGMLLLAAFFLRAGYLGAKRGGIRWRGRFYSTELLRAGRSYRP